MGYNSVCFSLSRSTAVGDSSSPVAVPVAQAKDVLNAIQNMSSAVTATFPSPVQDFFLEGTEVSIVDEEHASSPRNREQWAYSLSATRSMIDVLDEFKAVLLATDADRCETKKRIKHAISGLLRAVEELE